MQKKTGLLNKTQLHHYHTTPHHTCLLLLHCAAASSNTLLHTIATCISAYISCPLSASLLNGLSKLFQHATLLLSAA
jgi:hypothetical protein